MSSDLVYVPDPGEVKFIRAFVEKYDVDFADSSLVKDHLADLKNPGDEEKHELWFQMAVTADATASKISDLTMAKLWVKKYLAIEFTAFDIDVLFNVMISRDISDLEMSIYEDSFFDLSETEKKFLNGAHERPDSAIRNTIYRFIRYGEYNGVEMYGDDGEITNAGKAVVLDTSIFTISPYLYDMALNLGAKPIDPDPAELNKCLSLACLYQIYGNDYIPEKLEIYTSNTSVGHSIKSLWFDPALTVYWLNHGIMLPSRFFARMRLRAGAVTPDYHFIGTARNGDYVLYSKNQFWYDMRESLVKYVAIHANIDIIKDEVMQVLFGEFDESIRSIVRERYPESTFEADDVRTVYYQYSSVGPIDYVGVGRAKKYINDFYNNMNSYNREALLFFAMMYDGNFYAKLIELLRNMEEPDDPEEAKNRESMIKYICSEDIAMMAAEFSSPAAWKKLVANADWISSHYYVSASGDTWANFTYLNTIKSLLRLSEIGIDPYLTIFKRGTNSIKSFHVSKKQMIATIIEFMKLRPLEVANHPAFKKFFDKLIEDYDKLNNRDHDYDTLDRALLYESIRVKGIAGHVITDYYDRLDAIMTKSMGVNKDMGVNNDIMYSMVDANYDIPKSWFLEYHRPHTTPSGIYYMDKKRAYVVYAKVNIRYRESLSDIDATTVLKEFLTNRGSRSAYTTIKEMSAKGYRINFDEIVGLGFEAIKAYVTVMNEREMKNVLLPVTGEIFGRAADSSSIKYFLENGYVPNEYEIERVFKIVVASELRSIVDQIINCGSTITKRNLDSIMQSGAPIDDKIALTLRIIASFE